MRPDPVGIVADRRRAGDRAGALQQRHRAPVDKSDWDAAAETFARVAALKGERADAALYWRGVRPQQAVDARRRAEVARRAQDRISEEPVGEGCARARSRNPAGQRPDTAGRASRRNEDLKLMALSGLMNADPDKATADHQADAAGTPSPKLRERAHVRPRAERPARGAPGARRHREVEPEPGAADAGHPQPRTVRRPGEPSDAGRTSTRASQSIEARKAVLQAFMLVGRPRRVCSRSRARRRRPSCGARPSSSSA